MTTFIAMPVGLFTNRANIINKTEFGVKAAMGTDPLL
jgi:hypothetical protein